MDYEFLEKTYKEYLEVKKAQVITHNLVEYNWYKNPETIKGIWMPYFQMLELFSRELANEINKLISYRYNLMSWSEVIKNKNEDEKIEILFEQVEPIAITALNHPYAIKAKFYFAVSHLSHQANLTKLGNGWADDLPEDEDIFFSTMDEKSKVWKTYPKLRRALEPVGASNFRSQTKNFRNENTHRFSVNIEFGLSHTIKREVIDGKTRYSLGGTPPITLEEIVNSLDDEIKNIQSAFHEFKNLVNEQLRDIAAS